MSLKSAADVVDFIEAQPSMTATLAHLADLALPDSWIGAGFVRDAVWDTLHDRAWTPGAGDVDVLYFDPGGIRLEDERAIEARLRLIDPTQPWSVKNQARMHRRNGDAPYADCLDAIAHWLETCTAVAARLVDGRVELLAPYGVDDLLNLVLRPTDAGRRKPEAYAARSRDKRWRARWPSLREACPTSPGTKLADPSRVLDARRAVRSEPRV